MKPLYLATLGLTALLAGCGEKAATNVSAPANTAESMGNMAMPADTTAKTGKGTGTVTAIDKAAGKITLDHGPIPEVGWPAMTMAFKASPALLDSVAVGDKVAFDLALTGNAGEVTAIRKQP
ncbi:MAG: copper-binding protein [Pseudomonadota bacterium]|uniref:copper-binding protein n=1 Tax=Sphingomonas sp. R-74633 TaxID=2751188 RepID=UPI0015D3E27C|nr:copper-binding protein [Sphingomonas sp. R-74633]NYT40960.1 copper-binding protein [Sphingomonas sp. R-74633]